MASETPLAPDYAPEEQSLSQTLEALDAQQKRQQQEMMLDEDPLLISQTLTYVTDDGSVLHSSQSPNFSFGTRRHFLFSLSRCSTLCTHHIHVTIPHHVFFLRLFSFHSTGFKLRFFLLEIIFVMLLVAAVPIGAHGTAVAVSVANLVVLAWFWYNLVRSVDVTDDGALRFWIGNIEIDVPFDKIVSIRRVATSSPCFSLTPYRGFLSDPSDGVTIVTTVPSTPFWLWPRSAGKPDRSCCWGILACPRLTVVFSPTGGSLNFIREVENEMRNFSTGKMQRNRKQKSATPTSNPDFLDV